MVKKEKLSCEKRMVELGYSEGELKEIERIIAQEQHIYTEIYLELKDHSIFTVGMEKDSVYCWK